MKNKFIKFWLCLLMVFSALSISVDRALAAAYTFLRETMVMVLSQLLLVGMLLVLLLLVREDKVIQLQFMQSEVAVVLL